MNPLDLVKRYPIPAFFAGVAVVGGVILLSSGGGGAAPAQQMTTGPDANVVAAGTAINQMQIQAATANNQLATALAAKKEDNATALELAKLQAQFGTQNNQLAAEIERKRIETESADRQQYNTLQARALEQQYAFQSQMEQSRNATTLEMQKIMGNIVNRQTSATVQIAALNKPKPGFFSRIFG
jgi:deoxyhypusine synthase